MIGKSGDLSSAGEGWRALQAAMAKFVPELRAALVRAMEEQVVM